MKSVGISRQRSHRPTEPAVSVVLSVQFGVIFGYKSCELISGQPDAIPRGSDQHGDGGQLLAPREGGQTESSVGRKHLGDL